MNKVKLLTITVIGLLLLNAGILILLFYRHQGGRQHPPHEEPKYIIIKKLHFDDEQQKQYQVLIDDHRSRMNELRKESRELKTKLYMLLEQAKADTSAMNILITSIGEKQQEIEKVNFDHFRKIKNICSPSQLADYNKLLNELTDIFMPGPPPEKKPE